MSLMNELNIKPSLMDYSLKIVGFIRLAQVFSIILTMFIH